MALILNIDTALDTAYLSLARDGQVLASDFNDAEKDHAAWLHPAIAHLITQSGFQIEQLDAVGIILGPGSYTGLRIGLAAAKGLCYALRIPLIAEVSLKTMALSAILFVRSSENGHFPTDLAICPMIDARRMEVFTAIYDCELNELMTPRSMLLTRRSLEEELKRQKMLFLGNGSNKFQQLCQNSGAIFKKIPVNPIALASLTYANFIGNNFAELAYTEPLYLKEFFTKQTRS